MCIIGTFYYLVNLIYRFNGDKMVISRLHLVTSSDYTCKESIRLEIYILLHKFSCKKFYQFLCKKNIQIRLNFYSLFNIIL